MAFELGMSGQIARDEWAMLYDALREVCARHGAENPFGEADYWVVDDNWGGVSQKLIVTSPKFLTPKLVDEISRCIQRTQLYGAQVIIALDFKTMERESRPMMGLIVDFKGATEEWDLELLRRHCGPDFYTDL